MSGTHTAWRTRARRRVLGPVLALLLVAGVTAVGFAPAQAAAGDLAFGTVTVDANHNGALDATGTVGTADRPAAGVSVTLRGSVAGHPGWTTTTDANGHWAFPASADYSASPGPFTVRIDAAGVDGNNYLTPEAAVAGVNDFTRITGEPQQAVTAGFAATAAPAQFDALLYPTWSTDIIAAADPEGYQGNSIFTGTIPFDANDTEPGYDASKSNNRVRTGDVVNFNWSMTAAAEQDLDSDFNGWFEQTIDLAPGAIATFGTRPSACKAATSTITAYYPGGSKVLAPREEPPAGTTSVVLRCDVGQMGEEGGANRLLDTQIFVSGNAAADSSFTTSVRTYGATSGGVTTARPDGPEQFGPFKIVAAPRYDLVKQRPWSWNLGSKKVNGVDTVGYEIAYNIAITTDRKNGSEAFKQPVTFEDSLWANSTDGTSTQKPGFKWYMMACAPEGGGNNSVGPGPTTVYGKVGIAQTNGQPSTAANSVTDSGACAFSRVGNADTGNYKLTLSGIDTSGRKYPTTSVDGSTLPANTFYVASYHVRVFIPASEIDAMVPPTGDNAGSVNIWNRVGDFDPQGQSGASNFGSGVEPGYCRPGPNTDRNTKCDLINSTQPSNNVAGPATLTLSPGTWGKSLVDAGRTWAYRTGALPESTTMGDGAGQVQPGQTYTSVVTQRFNLETRNLQMCDVFDNSVLKLSELRNDATATPDNGDIAYPNPPGMYVANTTTTPTFGEPDRSKMLAFQNNWVTKYAHVDLTGDNPNNGQFDAAHSRWKGTWTKQKAAASGSSLACGSANVTWYNTPAQVPGGIDAVNAVWTTSSAGYTQPALTTVAWLIGLEQRDTYYGGPHAGQSIPELTIAANFANVKNSTYGDWGQTNSYIPGAGNTDNGTWADERGSSNMGDRWTIVRARMAITKHTVNGTVDGVPAEGAAPVGQTGSAEAGKPVIWQIDATLNAAASSPAPVHHVVVTDTLPAGAIYDPAATAALSGGTPADTYTVNSDGTTTLVWNLGTRTPNQAIAPLKVVTWADTLLPRNFDLLNKVTIKADEVVPAPNHAAQHTVTVTQSGSLQLKKSVDQPLDLTDDTQVYTLQMRNFSDTLRIQSPTLIDVLPYNNDATNDAHVNRNPHSDYAGSNTLQAAPKAFKFDGTTPAAGTFYYTTASPETVPQDLNADVPGLWSSTFTPDATAFKFVAANPLGNVNSGADAGIVVKFTTKQAGNEAGDLYANRFTAFSPTLYNNGKYQLLTSNQVLVRVVGFSLGDLIWLDTDNDGTYSAADTTAPKGVSVQVYDAQDHLVATTTTDEHGRWVVNDLPTGDYYAVIPASQFAPGGPLAGYVAQTAGYSADPNNDVNEHGDHNGLRTSTGAVKTPPIHLSATANGPALTGNEPLGDNTGGVKVTPGTTDGFTNFTLDMALTKYAPKIKIDKTASAIEDLDGNGPDVGDTITYSFVVTNTGTHPLTDVAVTDPMFAGVTCPKTALAPGESMTCDPITYTLKAADVSAGKVDNTATVTGHPPYGDPVTDDDSTHTPVVPTATETNVSITKTVDHANPAVGDTVTYTLTATNHGDLAAKDVTITDTLPEGVTFESASSPCTQAVGTVTCALGTLAPGASTSVTIKATVLAPTTTEAPQEHLLDVQKVEAQIDLADGETRTVTVDCAPGYAVTDGSGRIDHVDQGTGTLADVHVSESRATGQGTWQVTLSNAATGRAQGKVFAVCVQVATEVVNAHSHDLRFWAPATESVPLTAGVTNVDLTCAAGQVPITPGYRVGGGATVIGSHPTATGWRFTVQGGAGATGDFWIGCLEPTVTNAGGSTHALDLHYVTQTAVVAPGQTAEITVSCGPDEKGIVAGYDVPPGLVGLGNDPRPIVRVFKFYNPTAEPLTATMWLMCLGNRVEPNGGTATVVNTAKVKTSTPESTLTDNVDSVSFTVTAGAPTTPVVPTPPVTPVVPTTPTTPPGVPAAPGKVSLPAAVKVKGATVTTTVTCVGGTCTGTVTLVALKSFTLPSGKKVRKGAVLATGRYTLVGGPTSGQATKLTLKATARGKKALRSGAVKRARLVAAGTARTVKVR